MKICVSILLLLFLNLGIALAEETTPEMNSEEQFQLLEQEFEKFDQLHKRLDEELEAIDKFLDEAYHQWYDPLDLGAEQRLREYFRERNLGEMRWRQR